MVGVNRLVLWQRGAQPADRDDSSGGGHGHSRRQLRMPPKPPPRIWFESDRQPFTARPAAATLWSAALSPKVNLHHKIHFRAVSTDTMAQASNGFLGERNPLGPPSGQPKAVKGRPPLAVQTASVGSTE